jgi:hypothetical protein
MYFYKLTADNGGAPCVQDGLLSLAICKPMIRVKAKRGDVIFGFAANSLDPNNPLIYIARISDNISKGAYYREHKFTRRGDCIYRWRKGHFERRKDAKYHVDERHLAHDLGMAPDYNRANVLLSDDFRYFGGAGVAEYKSRYPVIRFAVEHLGRGQRVNHPTELRDQLRELEQQVWKETQQKIMGKPSSDPPSDFQHGVCHRSRSCGVVDSVKR